MKFRLWMSLPVLAAMMFGGTSCQEWGQMDPPSGNQVYPTLQTVDKVAFEDEDGNPGMPSSAKLTASSQGANPEVVVDNELKSPALYTNGGVAAFSNPMRSVVCQKAVGVSFWVKQPMDVDAEGNPVGKQQDLKGALISFVHNGEVAVDQPQEGRSRADVDAQIIKGRLSFSADGTVSYATDKGSYTHTGSTVMDSLWMAPNQWHFVALSVNDEGYNLYIDGKVAEQHKAEQFKQEQIVEFLNRATYVEFGSANTDPIIVDDVTFFRNEMDARAIKRPNKGNVGGGAEEDKNIFLFGPEDNIQGWWSIWSPSVNLVGDGVIHYEFTNYTIGNNNWENWVLVLTNTGRTPNDNGYGAADELIVLRADAWGWGAMWNPDNVEHNYNWDTFTHDMQGAKVDLTIERKGSEVVMTALTKTEAGLDYSYVVKIPGVEDNMIGAFFTLENAHMEFDANATYTGKQWNAGTNILGNKDFTNGFWTCWTEMCKMETPFKHFCMDFVNHSAKGGNWQFWNLVVTNGYQPAPDGQRDPEYSEYYYLRCDAYGWGGQYGASEMTHEFDWGTFQDDMDGAHSRLYFEFDNSTLTMRAVQWKADGEQIPLYKFVTPDVSLPVGLSLTCEGSWLDIFRMGYYPWTNEDAE